MRLSDKDRRRLAKSVRIVEDLSTSDPSAPIGVQPEGPIAGWQEWQLLKVTGPIDSGHYPATWYSYDSLTDTYSAETNVRAIEPNGGTLEEDTYYLGIAKGPDADGEMVFLVVAGSGTSSSGCTQCTMKVYQLADMEEGSATWTKPANLDFIVVEMVGGGGGGGGAEATTLHYNAGGGGGGGEYRRLRINAADLGATETVVVGDGGAGGDSTTPSNGDTGEETSFGSFAARPGVGGGAMADSDYLSQDVAAEPGGSGGGYGFDDSTDNDLLVAGQWGQRGERFLTTAFGGSGGNSFLGFGGPGKEGGSAYDGQKFGGGGAGASLGEASGAGASGVVIVSEYTCTS